MNQVRNKKYAELSKKIGETPLVKYKGEVANDNTIFIKRECDNPFGSHYDRVYLNLYKDWEENQGLKSGMNVLETTSGSAGVSFSGIGKYLGYNCLVMVPEGDQLQKRREAIKEQGAELILTPENEYINGFPSRILDNISKYNAKFLNHSMGRKGTNNEVTLNSLEEIALETLNETSIDFYIAGIGNGSSVVGPGRIFKKHNPEVKIIGYKPRNSGKSNFPGLINQEGLDSSIIIPFPHIREAEKLMDEEILFEESGETLIKYEDLGKTSLVGISVALEIANRVSNKNLLVLGYDKFERY